MNIRFSYCRGFEMESLAQEQIVANVLAQSDTKAVTELGEERMACKLAVSVFQNIRANECVWYLYHPLPSYLRAMFIGALCKPEYAGFATESNFGRMQRAKTAGKSLCSQVSTRWGREAFLVFFDVFCEFWHKGVLHFAEGLEFEWNVGRCV